jgi:hypothetical protein
MRLRHILTISTGTLLTRFLASVPPNVIDKSSRMCHVTAIRQAAWEAYEYLQKEVMHTEDALIISHCWTVDTPEWQDAVKYLQIRAYQLAVDKLEGLVVQHLFELTKANLSGTGTSVSACEHGYVSCGHYKGAKL